MIPKTLRLKGFIGIKSGLGLDEIRLDVDKLVGDAQLISIVGANGKGKSTILDNLHPYRIMPSRAGSYSPGSFSFYDNVYGSSALKELEFEHGGHRYRSTLVFKMGEKTRKTECYLHEWNGAQWEATCVNNVTSDGKTDTYDRCLESILGTPEMFFTSAFAAQGRPSLSSYTNGEIKGLLSELLGLNNILALGEKANEVCKGFKSALEGMRDDLHQLESLEAEHTKASESLILDEERHAVLVAQKPNAKELVAAASHHLTNAKAELGASAETESRRIRLNAQVSTIDSRYTDIARQIDTDERTANHEAQRAIDGLNTHLSTLRTNRITELGNINKWKGLLSRKSEIDAAVSRLPTVTADDNAAAQELDAARIKVEKYRGLKAECDTLRNQLSGISTEAANANERHQSLCKRSALIDEVPCKGTDLQKRCSLLAEANTAKSTVPQVVALLDQKRTEYAAIAAKGKAIEAVIQEMGNVEAALRDAEAKKNLSAATLRATSELAVQADGLGRLEEFIALATQRIADIDSSTSYDQTKIADIQKETDARMAELKARRADSDAKRKGELDAINHELALLPPPVGTGAVEAATAALSNAEAALTALEQELEQLNIAIGTHRETLRQIDIALANAGNMRRKAALLEQEIGYWTTLSKALGTDGIVALSIDDAGPTLSSMANDLLMTCYGPRFTVSMQTQEQNAKGQLKEVFDIIVFDAERDERKSLKDMSGGEKIYINDVLTRVIALYQAQSSGQKYGCLFSDESDGALDPEKKLQFVKMKREILRAGGYEREFYISHSKDVQECADAIINMESFINEGRNGDVHADSHASSR
jgi:exonuclease SbcC